MNNLIKAASISIAMATLIFIFAPQDKIDKGLESWRRLTNDGAQACLDYERRWLKDPDSAKLLESKVIGDSGIIIKYKAKNSYGAYVVGEDKYCYVNDNGVHEEITQLHRDNEESERNLAKLKAQNLCIERRNKLMREGAPYTEAVRKNPDCPIIRD